MLKIVFNQQSIINYIITGFILIYINKTRIIILPGKYKYIFVRLPWKDLPALRPLSCGLLGCVYWALYECLHPLHVIGLVLQFYRIRRVHFAPGTGSALLSLFCSNPYLHWSFFICFFFLSVECHCMPICFYEVCVGKNIWTNWYWIDNFIKKFKYLCTFTMVHTFYSNLIIFLCFHYPVNNFSFQMIPRYKVLQYFI